MKRYVHRMPSSNRTTMDVGVLYPVMCKEVMQGETLQMDIKALCRFQPLVAPAMVKMDMNVVHFFVPYRMLWDKWNDFIRSADEAPKEVPLCEIDVDFAKGSIITNPSPFVIPDNLLHRLAHFPLKSKNGTFGWENYNVYSIRAFLSFFPFMAYQKIWYDHFRDIELEGGSSDAKDKKFIEDLFNLYSTRYVDKQSKDDGNFNYEEFNKRFGLKRVKWKKDRFTGAFTQNQADRLDISININNVPSSGPLIFTGADTNKGENTIVWDNGGQLLANDYGNPSDDIPRREPWKIKQGLDFSYSVQDFKLAMMMYNFMVNQNRFGNTLDGYFAKFGLKNPDKRITKSQIIGGFSQRMQISDVLGTGDQNLGMQGGHMVGFAKNRGFKFFAEEAGIVMTMAYLRPEANYEYTTPRMFLKRDALDYIQPEYMKLGFQPVFKSEICNSNFREGANSLVHIPQSEDDMEIFGYEYRYKDYCFIPDEISGELDLLAGMFSHWVQPRKFEMPPNLNAEFITCSPLNNIWAMPNQDKAIVNFERNVTSINYVPHYQDLQVHI